MIDEILVVKHGHLLLDKIDVHITKSEVFKQLVRIFALTEDGKTIEIAVKSLTWQYHNDRFHSVRDIKPIWVKDDSCD